MVENVETEIFLDSCASMNMVSRYLLNKTDSKEPIGNIIETIFKAYSIATNSTDIYKLKLKIGTYEFEENFRVIDDNKLFNILIGIDSFKKNRFDWRILIPQQPLLHQDRYSLSFTKCRSV